MKQLHHLGEPCVKTILQPFATVIIEGAEVRILHTGQPHEIDVQFQQVLHTPGRIDILFYCYYKILSPDYLLIPNFINNFVPKYYGATMRLYSLTMHPLFHK